MGKTKQRSDEVGEQEEATVLRGSVRARSGDRRWSTFLMAVGMRCDGKDTGALLSDHKGTSADKMVCIKKAYLPAYLTDLADML